MSCSDTNSLPKSFTPEFHDHRVLLRNQKLYNFLGAAKLDVFKFGIGTAQWANGVEFDSKNEPYGYEFSLRQLTLGRALKEGANFVEVAPHYGKGRVERILGKAMSSMPRQAFYIATKVGWNQECKIDFTPEGIKKTFEKSLVSLKIKEIEAVTIGDLEYCDDLQKIVDEVLPVLEEYKKQGKVKFIGCSSYHLQHLIDIIKLAEGRIDYVISCGRANLYNRDLMNCKALVENKSIGLINGSLLGGGLLTAKLTNCTPSLPHAHPAPPELIESCKEANEKCEKLKLSLPRLAVKWTFENFARPNINLIGANTAEEFLICLSFMRNPLDEEEANLLKECLEVLEKCPVTHWEGIPVEEYRRDPEQFAAHLRADRCLKY